MDTNRDRNRQIMTVVAVLTTIAMNGASNSGAPLFNSTTIGGLADKYDTFFIPAGWVFAIWGLIYTGLIVYAIYQAQRPQAADPDLRRIYSWFLISCVANITWLFAWLYQRVGMSLLLMLVMLGSLIMIYLKLGIGRKPVSRWKKWFLHVPFSIYLGWITVATVANFTTYFVSISWAGLGIEQPVWSVIMMSVATVLGILMSLRHGDVAYVGVLIWAFIGIYAAYQNASTLVATTALILAGIAGLSLLIGVPINRKRLNLAPN